MHDSAQDLPSSQNVPPAFRIGQTAQFASIGLLLSGATAMVMSGLCFCLGIATSGALLSLQMTQGGPSSTDPMHLLMSGVGLAFTVSYLLPFATGAGGVYGGLLLHNGGSASRIRIAAIACVVGHVFLGVGAIPGILFGGCTSVLLLLASPVTTIVAIGAAVMVFMAVREGELLHQDASAASSEST